MTTSEGPFVYDVFWVPAGEHAGCMVPSEAEGCRKLLERLQRLPAFDNDAAIEAMSRTVDRRLVLPGVLLMTLAAVLAIVAPLRGGD